VRCNKGEGSTLGYASTSSARSGLVSSIPSAGGLEEHYRARRLAPTADLELVEKVYWHLAFRFHQEGRREELQRLNEAMSAVVLALGSPGARSVAPPPPAERPGILAALLTEVGWLVATASAVALGLGLAVGAVEPQGQLEALNEWQGPLVVGGAASLATVLAGVTAAVGASAMARLARSRTGPAQHDLYEVLHLDPSASPEVVGLAYAHLSKLCTLSGDGGRLLAVEEAYRVLSDPQLRASYDAQRTLKGAAPPRPATPPVAEEQPARAPAERRPSTIGPALATAARGTARALAVASLAVGRALWSGWRWSRPRLGRGVVLAARGTLVTARAAARGLAALVASRWQETAPLPPSPPAAGATLERLLRVRGENETVRRRPVEAPPPAASGPPTARLVVVEGPLAGRSFELRPDAAVTVGLDPDCDIVLEPAEGLAVPHLARIWPREDRFMLHLLAPEVPASVQGRPLVWVVLEDGDLLELGPYRLRFEVIRTDR